ncbi:MAG: energy transducer TonB [Lysobacteraceae bacterium]
MSEVPRITPADRLGATLVFSVLLHVAAILGIGFVVEDAAPLTPTLEVILTQTRTEQAPEKADFLAASNQQGGGDSDHARRPREAQTARVPQPETGIAPAPLEAGAPEPQPAEDLVAVATTAEVEPVTGIELASTPREPLPTQRELIEHRLEMARLAAEIDRQSEAYAKRPRRKFVSANTREYEYAAYLREWVARVERIGNLNYPDEARRRNLTGQLVMTVAVRRDGSVERIDIVQPSGYPLLDDAAQRTVRLAEPYPPLPVTRERIDILHITRTWQFLPGNILRNE